MDNSKPTFIRASCALLLGALALLGQHTYRQAEDLAIARERESVCQVRLESTDRMIDKLRNFGGGK
jgi:hypothetical protein